GGERKARRFSGACGHTVAESRVGPGVGPWRVAPRARLSSGRCPTPWVSQTRPGRPPLSRHGAFWGGHSPPVTRPLLSYMAHTKLPPWSLRSRRQPIAPTWPNAPYPYRASTVVPLGAGAGETAIS